ncbi:helix-turn-helix transcriptional regulator [Curtobacterium sp. A7_M15]|uniref:helix-turn-helix transcriptional regulator n=1 Tax=Curtobacterium sp. A7_M15 TaxID=3065241 RepID=UPI002737C770|nr:helix-turn-helix transcriptional regulator [Curtobacterium sp. A7_M15]MDP4334865.1 helix-turn-helix transcriptional regulator [Curtobacterium sp. A7_M15]
MAAPRLVGFDGAWASVLVGSGHDPLASVAAVGWLVDGAFAGVVLGDDGTVTPLPGLIGSPEGLLGRRSGLLSAVRDQPTSWTSPTAFLWPHDRPDGTHGHVRVTVFRFSAGSVGGVHGVVVLSPPPDLRGLTGRELEVLGHMLDGSSNDQIARALVVTSRTIATHVEHILLKLSSPSRTHAAVRAQREGLYVAPSAPSC